MSLSGATPDWVAQEDYEDLPPPPPEWFAPPFQAQPQYQRPVPTVILPPFRAQRPAAWFTQCEDLFRMRGITDQRDQFALCYGMLGDEQLTQVDDIAEMRPRPPDAFYRLRDRLVASHSVDAYQRLEQLLALPALGGQRPSALLAQMRQLCPPGEEGTMFFRAAFLQRLPPPVRLQLAEDRHSPVHLLAARADTLIAHHSYQAVAAVASQEAAGEHDSVVAAVRDGKFKDWRKKKGKAPQSGRGTAAAGKKEPWELLGVCRSHYKFGEDCYKCAEPSSCKWASGN
jgi:hypothetical protein